MMTIRLMPGRVVLDRHDGTTADVYLTTVDHLLPLLRCNVQLEGGFTLRDLLALIDVERVELLDAITGEDVSGLLAEVKALGVVEPADNLRLLRISRFMQFGDLLSGVDGVGPSEADGAEQEWGLDITSPRALLHLPLELDCRLRGVSSDVRLPWTLLDLIAAVVGELRWYGGPDEREAFSRSLDEAAANSRTGGPSGVLAADVAEDLCEEAPTDGTDEVEP